VIFQLFFHKLVSPTFSNLARYCSNAFQMR